MKTVTNALSGEEQEEEEEEEEEEEKEGHCIAACSVSAA